MTKLEALDLRGLGYTGERETSPVMSQVQFASNNSRSSFDFYFLHAGPIPESIRQLQSLTSLQLHNNKLSGAFTNISSGVWDVTSDVTSYFASIL
jgi:Leucine-rich repeat (LRR) protein